MDSIRRESEQEKADLLRLCGTLGKEAVLLRYDFRFPENRELLDAAVAAERAADREREALEELEKAREECELCNRLIGEAEKDLEKIGDELKSRAEVLGVVAGELYDSGNANSELLKYLESFIAYRKVISDLDAKIARATAVTSIFYKTQRKAREKDLRGIYCDIGEAVIRDGALDLLSGDRAKSIADEISDSKGIADALRTESQSKRNRLTEIRIELGLSDLSLLPGKIRDKRIELERLEATASLTEQQYGEFLAGCIDSWYTDACPGELSVCCSLIRDRKHKIHMKELDTQLVNYKKAAEVCETRIRSFEERVNYIDSQIETLLAQRDDLIGKIEKEQSNIRSINEKRESLVKEAAEAEK